MQGKKYFVGADILRIISGFGVVLIHVTDPFLSYPPYFGAGGFSWLIINIVNAFFRISVPLFVMLSGYLLLNSDREMNFKNFYKKRFFRITIPFVFWITFYFAWQYFFLGIPTNTYTIVTKILFVNLEHLYFLFIIVELYFITPLLYTFIKNTKKTSHFIFFLSSVLFTILLYIINDVFVDHSVKTQENLLTIFIPFISYYFAGYYLKKIKFFSKNSYYSFLFYMGCVLITAFASEGLVNSYLRSYGSFNIMLMSFLVFMIIINIDEKKKILQNKFVLNSIKNLASTVFGIYLVHIVIIDLVDKYLHLSVLDFSAPIWYVILLKVMLVFCVSGIIVFVIRKIPYLKTIFG